VSLYVKVDKTIYIAITSKQLHNIHASLWHFFKTKSFLSRLKSLCLCQVKSSRLSSGRPPSTSGHF